MCKKLAGVKKSSINCFRSCLHNICQPTLCNRPTEPSTAHPTPSVSSAMLSRRLHLSRASKRNPRAYNATRCACFPPPRQLQSQAELETELVCNPRAGCLRHSVAHLCLADNTHGRNGRCVHALVRFRQSVSCFFFFHIRFLFLSSSHNAMKHVLIKVP